MEHYYLLNGTVNKGGEMPNITNPNNDSLIYGDTYIRRWLSSLQPCEIDESELCLILSNVSKLDYDNPIDITDIVKEKDGKIYFKQPTEKQVESECEAVEFYKWTATLTPTSNENCFNKIRDGYYRIKPPIELYEIFKNR